MKKKKKTLNDKEMLQYLYNLGSADAIADFFEKKNIHGSIENEDNCPIAMYLKASPDKDAVFYVHANPKREGTGGEEGTEIIGCVADFVRKFDDGKYPKLIKNG